MRRDKSEPDGSPDPLKGASGPTAARAWRHNPYEIRPTKADDPARAAFVNELRAKRAAGKIADKRSIKVSVDDLGISVIVK